jgi:hypothetical protein
MDQVVGRIIEADDAEEVDLPIKYKTLVAICKLKRLLPWVLAVIPLILIGLGVVLYAVGAAG